MKYLLIPIVFTCLLVSSCTRTSIKENPRIKQLDTLMTYSHDHGMFNGSIAILQNNTIIFKQSYGFTNNNTTQKINTETLFYIASISKQFTAMAIMILQERGLLNYDDTISKYLPELKSIHKDVNIKNLLQHTSGISDRTYYQLTNPNNQDVFEKLKSLEDSSIGNPNQRFSYSNTGYVLLAFIIEKVSKTTIQDFFQKEIFDKLDMSRTTTYKEKFTSDLNKAYPYNILGLKSTYSSSVIGPGGIYSTVTDLIQWNTAINNNKLVTENTKKLAFTNGSIEGKPISFKLGKNEFGYGFGWSPFSKYNDHYVRHDGSTEGYRALIRKNLSKNTDIILLTNHGGAFAMDEIVDKLDQILETQTYTPPKIPLTNQIMNILNTKDIDAVVTMLTSTLNQDNKPDERVLGRLGYTMQNNGKINDAIALYKVNLDLYPTSINALYVLGEAYLSEKKYKLAKEIYNRFLEVQPDSEYAIEKLKLINGGLNKNNQ
ncbi:serine hydrolase [Tenacibaculum agarivorans]|uniref:serine hydrolase n=1 Tax=Tenacibaculum agarivorans TaxID=1908389 RepID=UPI00094B9B33|nr:serine hydrolase [Tenacibaculum agarivorans]